MITKHNKDRIPFVWRLLALLMLLLLATVALLGSQLSSKSVRDAKELDLTPSVINGDVERSKAILTTRGAWIRGEQIHAAPDGRVAQAHPEKPAESNADVASAQFSDDKQIWTTDTHIDVFREAWANDKGDITVESDDGDRVIAPGTGSDYSFYIKNTGDVEILYKMDLKSFFEEGSEYVPVRVRLRSGSTWLVGGPDQWEDPAKLVEYSEAGRMVAKGSKSFTFEWEWPFEKGEGEALKTRDEKDTVLGNEAVTKDIHFTLQINTYAEADTATGPKTGDDAQPLLYAVLLIAAAAGIVILLLVITKKKKAEADDEKGPQQ